MSFVVSFRLKSHRPLFNRKDKFGPSGIFFVDIIERHESLCGYGFVRHTPAFGKSARSLPQIRGIIRVLLPPWRNSVCRTDGHVPRNIASAAIRDPQVPGAPFPNTFTALFTLSRSQAGNIFKFIRKSKPFALFQKRSNWLLDIPKLVYENIVFKESCLM